MSYRQQEPSQKDAANLRQSLLNANNVDAIKRVHEDFQGRRTWTDHLGCVITTYSGRLSAVLLHVVWFAVWIALNCGLIPGFHAFDPFPFTFLTLVVSLEAIFLTFFVLMGQNAQSAQTDRLARLDLQVNMLAEQEMTEVLRLLRELCKREGITTKHDDKIAEMIEETSIETLAKTLDEAQLDGAHKRHRPLPKERAARVK